MIRNRDVPKGRKDLADDFGGAEIPCPDWEKQKTKESDLLGFFGMKK